MESIVSEAEQMLLQWIIRHLDRTEQKDIHCGGDVLRSLSMDAEDEVRNQVWELIKNELNYGWIVDKVKEEIADHPETEDEEEEEEAKADSDSE